MLNLLLDEHRVGVSINIVLDKKILQEFILVERILLNFYQGFALNCINKVSDIIIPIIIICIRTNTKKGEKILTHWGRDKMAVIFQTFSNAFSWMKMYEIQLKFHLSWLLRAW